MLAGALFFVHLKILVLSIGEVWKTFFMVLFLFKIGYWHSRDYGITFLGNTGFTRVNAFVLNLPK